MFSAVFSEAIEDKSGYAHPATVVSQQERANVYDVITFYRVGQR